MKTEKTDVDTTLMQSKYFSDDYYMNPNLKFKDPTQKNIGDTEDTVQIVWQLKPIL